MKRSNFIQLTGLTGLGLLTSNNLLSGYFDSLPPDGQKFICVAGISANPAYSGKPGIHLRWELPPAKGFPDNIIIYRRKDGPSPVLPVFSANPKDLAYLLQCCSENDQKGWQVVGKINNAEDFTNQDAIFKRLNDAGLYNYYLPATPANLRSSRLLFYKNLATDYAGILKALAAPSADVFVLQPPYQNIADIPRNELQFKPVNNSSAVLKAWNLLMFAAIDPNIATMLGLYFVDTSANDTNGYYEYKIEAFYQQGNEHICGVLRQVPDTYSAAPVLAENLQAIQMASTSWTFNEANTVKKQSGAVRLSWPAVLPANDDLQNRYTSPVVYALKKNGQGKKLIAPVEDTGNLQLVFTDRDTPITNNNYHISGVNIFGQESNALAASCLLTDKDSPPPPGRLSFIEKNNGIHLQFEYGAGQYLTAPDAKEFVVYQRNENAYDSRKIKFTLRSGVGSTQVGNNIYQLLLTAPGDISNYHFLSFESDAADKKLGASLRKKFAITAADGNTITFVSTIPGYQPPSTGWLRLTRRPGTKSIEWGQPIGRVPFAPPVSLSFRSTRAYTHFIRNTGDEIYYAGDTPNDTHFFSCRVVKASYQVPEKDLFEPAAADNAALLEILLDRSLYAADVFTNGFAKIGNQVYPVIHQSAGTAAAPNNAASPTQRNNHPRIYIRTETVISVALGSSLQLYLPSTNAVAADSNKISGYCILRLNGSHQPPVPGGELLLKADRKVIIDGNAEIVPVNITARLCSDGMEPLVYIDKKIHAIDISKPVFWFAPYQLNITQRISSIALLPTQAHVAAFFSIETIDAGSPVHTSALSAVAQFIKTRSILEKPERPAPPFPCANASATEAFLKIPNKEGRSAFCVGWNDIKNAQGQSKGYRYEVGRALDKTVVAVHKDAWLKGNNNGLPPVSSELVKNLSFGAADAVTHLITASFSKSSTGRPDWEKFRNGRFKQVSNGKVMSFEIVQISGTNERASAQLRPMVAATLPIAEANGVISQLDQLPDYALLEKDTARLKLLAENCEAAFSLVTGQPLRNSTQYLDDVPGTGSSRFFYKVRSVDASENRSAWSLASIPVWQTDTRPPDAVSEFSGHSINNKAFLFWKKPVPLAAGYIITRRQVSNGAVQSIRKQAPDLKDKPLQLLNAEIIVPAAGLELQLPLTVTNKEAATVFLAAQLSLYSIAGTVKTIVAGNSYTLLFQFNPGNRKATITAINLTQKKDAGINFEVHFQNSIINTESGYLHYIDDTVLENETYTYEIAAIKKTGPASNPLSIPGLPAQSRQITIQKLSQPAGVSVTRSFISLSNTPLPGFQPEARTRITITKPAQQLFVRISKRLADATKKALYTEFTNETDNIIYKDWIALPQESSSISLIDNSIGTIPNFEYAIELKSASGIFSDSIILTIS